MMTSLICNDSALLTQFELATVVVAMFALGAVIGFIAGVLRSNP
jgi:hypothetical protein